MKNKNILPAMLGLCMFTTGGAGLVIQYLLATATTFVLGSSIVVFSLVIGTMLGAMGLSGWIQERISDQNLIIKFFIIETLLFVLGCFSVFIIYWSYGFAPDHFNFFLYSMVISIGVLIGLEIPIVVRILDQMDVAIARNMKLVFGLDYAGAMVFMLFWVFVLLPNPMFTLYNIGFIVSGINYSIAVLTISIFLIASSSKALSYIKVFAVIALLFPIYIYGISNSENWDLTLEQKLYDDPVVFSHTTRYQHLVLTKRKTKSCGVDYRLYINGNTQFSSCDEYIYHENLVVPVMEITKANSVLIIGGGDGLALRDVLKYNPSKVDIVDLDKDMVDFARSDAYLSSLNSGAFNNAVVTDISLSTSPKDGVFNPVVIDGEEVAYVRRFHFDASVFIRSIGNRYDAIIIDLPDPSSVELSRLYTRGFYRALSTRLSADGVMVMQSTSPLHAPEVFLEIGRTLESAGFNTLPYQDNIPSFGNWGFWMGCVSGCQDLYTRLSGVKDFSIKTKYLTPQKMLSNLSFGKRNGLDFLQSAELETLNTDTNPTLFLRYEGSWEDY